MSDLSEQLDECIYPKTEEVLYSSPDGEVLEAIYLIEFQHNEDSKVPINLNKKSTCRRRPLHSFFRRLS